MVDPCFPPGISFAEPQHLGVQPGGRSQHQPRHAGPGRHTSESQEGDLWVWAGGRLPSGSDRPVAFQGVDTYGGDTGVISESWTQKLDPSTPVLAIESRHRNTTATHICVSHSNSFAKICQIALTDPNFSDSGGHSVTNIEPPRCQRFHFRSTW